MTQPFLGQISVFGFGFAPRNWALCQGQLLSISQNTALFALLGTQFGGNGTTTFALPDLRGRVPLHTGQGSGLSSFIMGEQSGETTVTLTTQTMPAHNHGFSASTDKTTVATSSGNVLGKAQKGSPQQGLTKGLMYSPNAPNTATSGSSLTLFGSGQAHNNMQPYLTLNYCIAMAGVFPARN